MICYKEKGYLVRRIVFVHSILLYNSMSNFTDHEFDKEGLIRRVCIDQFPINEEEEKNDFLLAISRCWSY